MKHWITIAPLTVLVAAGLLAALPGAAQKKNQAKPDAVVGFVDLGLVTEQVKQTPEWKQMVGEFENEKTRYRTELEDMQRLRYLTKTEREELTNLRAKTKASDAEKGRVDALLKRSDELEGEFRTLAGVEKPNDEQGKRLGELQKLRDQGIQILQEETEKRAGYLQKKEGELLQKMQDRILKIVGQVAEGKGMVMVVDRQAILFGGTDLTDDVVKKLK
jgi:Skp family chaperone for outer membrane proteins